MSEINKVFKNALSLHMNGQIDQAKSLYEAYLSEFVNSYVARTNLAAIYLDRGALVDARKLLNVALAESPDYPEALCNFGHLELRENNIESAFNCFENSLRFSPQLLPALVNIIPMLIEKCMYTEALAYLDKASKLHDFSPELLKLRLEVLYHSDGLTGVYDLLNDQQLFEKLPNQGNAYHSAIGSFLLTKYEYGAALEHIQQALNVSISHLDSVNKGEALRRLKRTPEALEWVDLSIGKFPESSLLLNLKACLLQENRRLNEALEFYDRALELDSSNPLIFSNKGFIQIEAGQYRNALLTFEKGLALDKTYASCWHGVAQANFYLTKPRKALYAYNKALTNKKSSLNIWDNFLYFLSFTNLVVDDELLNIYNRYCDSALRPKLIANDFKSQYKFLPLRRRHLRIGILSAEIGDHCVSSFLKSFLIGADPKKVEFYLFPTLNRPKESGWDEIKELCAHFEPIDQLSDIEAIEKIRDFKLDVILETSQHMTANRLPLLFNRLAPVQAHYIGMHGSTGLNEVDYFIGDKFVTKSSFSSSFTEKFLTLPRTWVCYTPPKELPVLRKSKNSGRELVLGCFNNITKISRECLKLWSEILIAMPNSKLVLKDSLRHGELDQHSQILDYLIKRGIDEGRCKIVPRTETWLDHMDLYNDIDIALDTTPLNSGTTAFDALLMGTPIIGYSSEWMGGQMTCSILNGLGKQEWVASNSIEYIRILKNFEKCLPAVRKDTDSLRTLFLKSSLCDQIDLAKSLTQALIKAYNKCKVIYS